MAQRRPWRTRRSAWPNGRRAILTSPAACSSGSVWRARWPTIPAMLLDGRSVLGARSADPHRDAGSELLRCSGPQAQLSSSSRTTSTRRSASATVSPSWKAATWAGGHRRGDPAQPGQRLRALLLPQRGCDLDVSAADIRPQDQAIIDHAGMGCAARSNAALPTTARFGYVVDPTSA